MNRADNHSRFNSRDDNDVSLLNKVDYRELRREKGGVVVEPKRGEWKPMKASMIHESHEF